MIEGGEGQIGDLQESEVQQLGVIGVWLHCKLVSSTSLQELLQSASAAVELSNRSELFKNFKYFNFTLLLDVLLKNTQKYKTEKKI